MSDETLDANCAAMMRKSLEAGIGALQAASQRQQHVTHGTIGVVLQAALAALPQREEAQTNPFHRCRNCGWTWPMTDTAPVCGAKGTSVRCVPTQLPAAPPEGEPIEPIGFSSRKHGTATFCMKAAWLDMRDYARSQRERAEAAEADNAEVRRLWAADTQEKCRERDAAWAELAKLREQKPVAWTLLTKSGPRGLYVEKPSDGTLVTPLYAAPVPPADASTAALSNERNALADEVDALKADHAQALRLAEARKRHLEGLSHDLAKALGCEETNEAIVGAVEALRIPRAQARAATPAEDWKVIAFEWVNAKTLTHELRWSDDDEMLEEHGFEAHELVCQAEAERRIREARAQVWREAEAAAKKLRAFALAFHFRAKANEAAS